MENASALANRPPEKPGRCEVCRVAIPAGEAWHRIHLGEHRETQLDICKGCGQQGYLFWNGSVHVEPGSIAAQVNSGGYPLRPSYRRTARSKRSGRARGAVPEGTP